MLTVFTSEGFIMYKRCDRSLKLDYGAMPDYTLLPFSIFFYLKSFFIDLGS